MEHFSCSPVTSVRQYIILFNDDLMSMFVENPIILSCGNKTRCRISLTNRVLNRSVRPGFWSRYFIVNVVGEDHFAIERCNKLLERHIPQYRHRQRYRCRSHVTMFTNEWLPDNTAVCETSMRMGALRSEFGNLKIVSPYANHAFRTAFQTPWKATNREFLGHYEVHDIYRPILAMATIPKSDYPSLNLTNYKDIAKFSWPNSFDRYTTNRAIDNEHVKRKLQKKCVKLMKMIKGNSDVPPPVNQLPDPRQSSKIIFERNNPRALIGGKSRAISLSKTTYCQFESPPLKKIKSSRKGMKRSTQRNDTIPEEDENNLTNDISTIEPIFEDDNKVYKKKNQNNLNDSENQNQNQNQSQLILLSPPSCNTPDSFFNSEKNVSKERKKRRNSKGIRLNRYIRLYNLKQKRKCINYKGIRRQFVQSESDSEITLVSSNTSNNASKASNVEDNTMDSLKSF